MCWAFKIYESLLHERSTSLLLQVLINKNKQNSAPQTRILSQQDEKKKEFIDTNQMYANPNTKIPKHKYTNPKTWMLSHQDEKKKELARTLGEDQAVLSDAKTRSILGIPLLHTNQSLLHENPSFS